MPVVKPNHPIAEVVARKLHGISGVPVEEQRRMVQRAANAAFDYHNKKTGELVDASVDVLRAFQDFHDGNAMNDSGLYDRLAGACLKLRRALKGK